MVEPTGVEPVSENLLISLSPGAFCFLEFPLRDANRQASHLGSRFIHDRFNGKPPVRIHHLPDAHTGVVILPGGTGGIKPQKIRFIIRKIAVNAAILAMYFKRYAPKTDK